MTRIRLTLLFLLLGIAVPTALIVQRAVESLEVENAVQHDAVANRIFDEMERSLSDFLLREEARPPSDFQAVPSGSSASPLRRLRASAFGDADEPFIVGWFAVNASREISIHSASGYETQGNQSARIALALREGLGSRAPSLGASEDRDDESEQKRESYDARKRLAEAFTNAAAESDRLQQESEETSDDGMSRPDAPAPGRTKSLSKAGKLRRKKADTDLAAQDDASAYELLQSLNRAQVLRSERQSKVLSEPQKDAGARAAPAPRIAAESAAAPQGADEFADKMPAEAELVEMLPREYAVDPLTSHTTLSGDLLLVRSVWRGGEVERQGLVLDRQALASWLDRSVLGEAALAERADLVFGPEADQVSRAAHAYLHRFGEPFEALFARLDLQSLPGVGSARPIYMIVGLLALVTILGLIAVERMTRVVVEFAQRRSDFVAAVSHELKTPLTSIRMYSEMLRDGLVPSPEKRDEYYATITDESERLSRLIDNVLEFSRLEQNRREPTLVVGGVAEAVREAAEKMRAHVEREGFALEIDLATEAPSVQYDRDAVTQLLFNLVDNALKYARDAEDRRIRVVLKPSERGILELRVRDFGPGVPEDQMRRIFEPFYRAGEELTRDTAGTGIGLALVKELAEDMGATALGRNANGGGFEVCIAFSPAATTA